MVDGSKPTKQDQSTQNLLKWPGKLEQLFVSGFPLGMISPDKIALSNSAAMVEQFCSLHFMVRGRCVPDLNLGLSCGTQAHAEIGGQRCGAAAYGTMV